MLRVRPCCSTGTVCAEGIAWRARAACCGERRSEELSGLETSEELEELEELSELSRTLELTAEVPEHAKHVLRGQKLESAKIDRSPVDALLDCWTAASAAPRTPLPHSHVTARSAGSTWTQPAP